MVHNTSARRRHELAMDSRLAEWRGSLLCVRCDGPGHVKRVSVWPVEELERGKPGLTVAAWVRRLRCLVCQNRPVGIALRIPAFRGQLTSQDRWEPLIGRGAPDQGEVAREPAEWSTYHVRWWVL
jgi:hypothetical protein